MRRVVSADRNPTTGLAANVLCDGGPDAAPMPCAAAPFLFIGTTTPESSGSISNTITIRQRLRLYGLVDFQRGNILWNANDLLRCVGGFGAPLRRYLQGCRQRRGAGLFQLYHLLGVRQAGRQTAF